MEYDYPVPLYELNIDSLFSKTEVMFMSSRYNCNPLSLDSFAIDNTLIKPVTSVRNIGVVFDNTVATASASNISNLKCEH